MRAGRLRVPGAGGRMSRRVATMFLLAKARAPAAGVSRTLSSPIAAGAFCHSARARQRWTPLLDALVLIASLFAAVDADASERLPDLRFGTAYQGKFDADIYTAAWQVGAPAWSRAHRLELAAGVITSRAASRPFGFIGPVWRIASRRRASFFEFSFGPTLIGGSTIDGRELGGNLHFRSALALGLFAGRTIEISMRIEHVSNGGLRDDNPGLDAVGIGFAFSTGVLCD